MTKEITGPFTTTDVKLPRRIKKDLKKQVLCRLWLAPRRYKGKHIRLESVVWHNYFQQWIMSSYSIA